MNNLNALDQIIVESHKAEMSKLEDILEAMVEVKNNLDKLLKAFNDDDL
jgi:conjugal transfer/entry exclusion protein